MIGAVSRKDGGPKALDCWKAGPRLSSGHSRGTHGLSTHSLQVVSYGWFWEAAMFGWGSSA
eukprot:7300924-Heterocapsa_arctica.AAC.1